MFFLFVLLTGTASAQVYRWTDADGKVHYGDKPPAGKPATTLPAPPASGSGTQAIQGGGTLSVPLPQPSARDLEIQRRQEADDEEREAKERAAFRNSPQGVDQCRRIEQDLRNAQQGLIREERGTRQMNAVEQTMMVEALTVRRDRTCR